MKKTLPSLLAFSLIFTLASLAPAQDQIQVEELNTDADTSLNPERETGTREETYEEADTVDSDEDMNVVTEVDIDTDTGDGDVERILSEIEEDTPEPDASGSETEVETADTGMDADMSTDEPSDNPDAVPAISLEEAESVEGLNITGDDPRRGLITINYENVKLADMVRIFAQTSGANIIIPEGLDQPVSGNLNDVYWQEALEVILEERGFALVERKSGIYTITPEDQLAAEPLASETIELQFISADDAKPAVDNMLVNSNATATAIPAANVLIVNDTPQQIQEIKRMIKLVDQPRKQVFIEAKFVELNDSAIKDLGINWQVLQGYTVRATGMQTEYTRTDTRISNDAQGFIYGRTDFENRDRNTVDDELTAGTDADTSSRQTGDMESMFEAVVQGKNFTDIDGENGSITSEPAMEQEVVKSAVLSADDFALTLSALQQLDGVRIVSNPKMLVANGQTASIHVGRNEPNIRAVPQGENANTFAYVLDGYIEIGVKLEVTPVISTAKNITVGIIPELSRLIGQKEVGEAGTSFPITQIRRINTEFAVESGKTVAIGGLTQSNEQENVNKIPLLGDIPIIGKYLFTHTHTETVQDEIIIFVSVSTAHTEELDDRFGIPQEGKLIHTWLDQRNGVQTRR